MHDDNNKQLSRDLSLMTRHAAGLEAANADALQQLDSSRFEIAALKAQRDELAEALVEIRRIELASAAELERLTGEPVARLPWMDQLEAALRNAGRLPQEVKP